MAKTLRILLEESLAERSEGARGLFTSSILNVFRGLWVVTKQTLVNIFSISYSTRMLTKLGAYLDQQPIKRTIRFTAPSGEKFVVMPVKEYTMLTGIDVDTLPMAEIPDSISEGARETDSSAHTRNTETDTSGEFGRFSALAHIPLEEEIGVDKLPL